MRKFNAVTFSEFFSNVGKDIYDRAVNAVNLYGMREKIEKGVLVGLSGGSDSVLLLSFLVEYRRREKLDFNIVAAHVNHCIRAEEAKRDEDFCRKICEEADIEFVVHCADVPGIAKDLGIGIEEAARKTRYSFFEDIIRGRTDLNTIAVAHNMSDNAETVIFNILRGCGSRGASGIRPVRNNIIRPLIGISKGDIISALESFSISYVTDSTNLSVDYTRNYIRHEIMPKLFKLSDSPEKMLLRFSDNMFCDDEFISSVAKEFLSNRNEIRNDELLSLDYAVYIRVLSEMIDSSRGNISVAIASDIHKILYKDNFSYSVGGGVTFVCERGVCKISENSADNKVDYIFPINPGRNNIDTFKAEVLLSEKKIEKTYLNVYKMSIQADLSSAIIEGDLYLRPKRDGDAVFYGGMTHKLKKLFNDRKIPTSLRSNLPILCDSKGVVWVPGFGVRDDGILNQNKKKLFVLIGLNDDKSGGEGRFIFGSEFKS